MLSSNEDLAIETRKDPTGSPVSHGTVGSSHGTKDATVLEPPWDRLGRYRLDTYLGAGGFGVVFRARDSVRDVPVVVKVLHAELATQAWAVARFEREARLLALTRHPNIVRVLDGGETPDGRPFFVMERLEGVDLNQHLAEAGRLSREETLAIVGPVCRALGAIHRRGIVHRDLKPANVFLDVSRGERRVVLLDLGVAKLMDDTAPSLTSSQLIIGTPRAMAPEQIRGLEVDARTDVYALGVLTFQLLTGRPPFAHDDSRLVMDMHVTLAPPPPSEFAPVGTAVDACVLRALAKDPAERPESVDAFLALLEAAVL